MARDFNQNRNTNAKLVNATIDKYGASYPAQSPWRADGFNKVFVETEGANPTQKDFLEGNSSVYVYAIGSNISSLLPYSLASFPNIKELYLFSSTMVDIGAIDNDYLTYLTNNQLKVYVPSNTLQSYINTYGDTGKHLENRFEEINDDYPLTVSGSGDLTSQELTNQLMNKYEQVDRTNCTKLIIQGFTNVGSIIWAYDFSEILPNLESVWVNGVKFDFSVLNIVGSGTLTEIDIDNAISNIGLSNRGGVLEVKYSGYSDMSVALEYNYEDLPNLEYLWLDNVRYDVDDILGENILKVDYIEDPGSYSNCHLDPNILISNIRKLEIKMKSVDYATRNGAQMFITNTPMFAIQNGNITRNGWDVTPTFNPNIQKDSFNNVVTITLDNINVATSSKVIIGSWNGSTAWDSKKTFYEITIWGDDNVVLYHGIPAYNIQSDEYSLFDTISKTFTIQSGTVLYTGTIPSMVYFYPLSNLETEYNANLNQTFYLDYNGTLPTINSDYQVTYYSDINCTTTISISDMVSGTRYYIKATRVTLTIQGSGTLTSAIVSEQASKAGSGVTKVIVPNTFTYTSASALCFDPIDTYLPNVDTLELTSIPMQYQGSYSVYSNWNTSDCKFKTMIYNGSSISPNGLRGWKINRLYCNLLTNAGVNSLMSITYYEIKLPLLEYFPPSFLQSSNFSNCEYVLFENAKRFGNLAMNSVSFGGKSLYLPKITTLEGMSINAFNYNLFIGTDNCSLDGLLGQGMNYRPLYIYFKANILIDYKIATNWSSYSQYMVGVIDGNSVYTDKGFSYPKLTGIDTEANIQLLTPSEDSLYLASDTGDLWQYSSGAWANVFGENYQGGATWYSDEGCTTQILPTNITINMTVYVKLIWTNSTLTINAQSGETTLTADIVTRELAKASSNYGVVTKVIIPVDFTSYDSGTITAMQNALPNLRYLETTYEEGAMELDLQGEIVTKIASINKTLDEALVYARYISLNMPSSFNNNSTVIIIPPVKINQVSMQLYFNNCSNLIYVPKFINEYNGVINTINTYANDISKLIEINIYYPNSTGSSNNTNNYGCQNAKVFRILFGTNYTNAPTSIFTLYSNGSKLTSLVLENAKNGNIDLSSGSYLSREVLVELFNKLGTNETSKTITLHSTALGNLTADDIAIATAKNWVVQ